MAQNVDTLKTNPFFELGPGLESLGQAGNGDFINQLVYQVPGLASFYQHNEPAQHHVSVRDWLLAEAFPATTLPMGANKNNSQDFVPENNFDMSEKFKTDKNEWPREETIPGRGKDWLHGDYKDISYQHNFWFYDKIKKLSDQ